MGTLSLGSLKFTVGWDDAPLKQGEKSTNEALGRTAANFDKTSGRIISTASKVSLAVAAAMYKASGSISQTVERISDLSNAATNMGIAVESFSALEFAARKLGVEVQNLESGFSTLIKKMQEKEPIDEGVRVFSALGISVRDAAGNMLGADAVFSKVADKFARMKDGPEKVSIAMRLFGDSGAKLLPVLNQGSRGLEELRNQALATGSVISADTAAAFNEMKATSSDLSSMLGTTLVNATVSLKPAFDAIAQVFGDTGNKAAILDAGSKTLALTFKTLATVASGVGFVFSSMYTSISTVALATYQLATGKFSEAWETIKAGGKQVATQFDNTGKIVWETWMGTSEKLAKSAEEFPKKFAAPIVKSAEDVTKALEAIKKQNQYMFQDLLDDKTLKVAEKLDQLEVLVRKGAVSWREYHGAVKAIKDEQDGFAFQDLMDADTKPMEEKLASLKNMVDRGAISWREYTQAVKSVTKSNEQSMDDLLSTTSSVLTQIFSKSKAAAIASAIINTYQGITKAIATYPPPISYAMAGLQAALGFAQVRAISSTSQGSSTASSSSGASSAAVASGSTAAAGGGGGGSDSTLFVKGISHDALFTGESVRALASKLVEFQKDGGKVVIGA